MISVVIASFNGQKYIGHQLESILVQLGTDDEVIISDDGSTDQTIEIVRQYMKTDSRIQLFDGPHAGHIKNFEYAISKCSGEIIILSDQDDIWLPGKIDAIIERFKNGKKHLVVHNMYRCNDHQIDNMQYGDTYFSTIRIRSGVMPNIIHSFYFGCCMAFDSFIREIILPFPSGLHVHDQWIGLIGEYLKAVEIINEPYLIHREHDSNLTYRKSIYKAISSRIKLLTIFLITLVNKRNQIKMARYGRETK